MRTFIQLFPIEINICNIYLIIVILRRKRSYRTGDFAFLVFSSIIGCFTIMAIINAFRDSSVGEQGTFLIAEALIIGFIFLFIILMTIIIMLLITRQSPTVRIARITDLSLLNNQNLPRMESSKEVSEKS